MKKIGTKGKMAIAGAVGFAGIVGMIVAYFTGKKNDIPDENSVEFIGDVEPVEADNEEE